MCKGRIDIVPILIAETQGDTSGPHSRLKAWKDVDLEEMKQFFGLLVLMGLVKKHKLEEYWSLSTETRTPFFSKVMSRNRFQAINAMLHFADNEQAVPRGSPGHDPLFKVRPVLNEAMKRSVGAYQPDKELSVDEHCCPFKGRVAFRVFEQNKPKRFHIRLYMVTEAKSGYVLAYIPYTRCPTSDRDVDGENLDAKETTKVVVSLLKKARALDKGHEVYMDRFYSSPELATALYEHNTFVCGTVAPNRNGMPVSLKPKGTKDFTRPHGTGLKVWDTIWRTKSPMCTLVWRDKKQVAMLSTTLGPTACPFVVKKRTGQRDQAGRATFTFHQILKPEMILQYNKFKVGVDLAGQRVFNYYLARRGCKWWRKLALHCFDLQLCNAYLLYTKAFDRYAEENMTQTRCLSHYDFRLSIARYLLNRDSIPYLEDLPSRMSTRCFPRPLEKSRPPKDPDTARKTPCRPCFVCKEASKLTGDNSYNNYSQSGCSTCKKTLCVRVHPKSRPPVTCFELFHSQKHFGHSRADIPVPSACETLLDNTRSTDFLDFTNDLNDRTLDSQPDIHGTDLDNLTPEEVAFDETDSEADSDNELLPFPLSSDEDEP